MKYEVTYTQILHRLVDVEAASLAQALEKVAEALRDNPSITDKASTITAEERKTVSAWEHNT